MFNSRRFSADDKNDDDVIVSVPEVDSRLR